MSNTYKLTEQIHTEIERINTKHGLQIDTYNHFWWFSYKYDHNVIVKHNEHYSVINDDEDYYKSIFPALNPENITKLLIDLQGLLGANREYENIKNLNKDGNRLGDWFIDYVNKHTVTTQAKVLSEKWFSIQEIEKTTEEIVFAPSKPTSSHDYKPDIRHKVIPSLWSTNQDQVLQELLEILKGI